MKYCHIFFDLDRTLWDFDTNSRAALTELYDKYQLIDRGIRSAQTFVNVYESINQSLWARYRNGRVTKKVLRSTRFAKTLEHLGYRNDTLGREMEKAYIAISPLKTAVEPNALEVLTYLSTKYRLHIITNGFEEVQHLKLEKSGLADFFVHVVTSERAAARKPGRKVFEYAFGLTEARAEDSLMIGDDLATDIAGARNMAMDQVYYNPGKEKHEVETTYEIQDLSELRGFL